MKILIHHISLFVLNKLFPLLEDHNNEEMDEFLCEIAIMKSISRHPNVVALIGYCTVKQPMLMVMEYVGCGDLVSVIYDIVGIIYWILVELHFI